MTTMDLSGRIAVVTGASSGLGAHFAQVLGRAGAHVSLIARSRDKLDALAATLHASGVSADGHVADVTDRASLERAFSTVAKDHGRVDVLVNNAGIARTAPFLEMEDDDWQSVLDTDLSGVWRCGQIAARIMAADGKGGAIVNISSILAVAVQPTQTNYAAAKAGVAHLTRAMARELGRHRIRVNAIAPGYFQTEINADFFASASGEKLLSKIFPRRLGQLHELDAPLLLLASDAGSFITGTTLTVDGGATLSGI